MRVQAEPSDIFFNVDGAPCRVWNAVTESGIQVFLFVCRMAVPNESRDALFFENELIETAHPAISKSDDSITCPRCAMISYHPSDVSNRYCGNCHQFHDLMLDEWLHAIRNDEPEPSGDFLRALAEAAVRADPENQVILAPALFQIMARFPKYRCSAKEEL